jgi:NAD(P)-dependent dehydrogenase (short-subunit alcohol dehydrogenase family)
MKNVLVTGAGRGLGRAIAKAFYLDGFSVIATDIDIRIFSDIADKERYTCIKLDVTSEMDVRRCAAYTDEKFGQIDVLVSNAGIFDFYPVSESGADHLKKLFDVNVFGLTNLSKYFLPQLLRNKGRLIVIGSESYKVPSPFQPYAVSKQALESIFKSINIELSLKGIKSILIRPGAIRTKILDDTVLFRKEMNNSRFD